jgi:predicted permease
MLSKGSRGSAMHDWKAYVRDHLRELRIGPARENEIVAELAQHLESAYYDALADGWGENEATRRAVARFADWKELASEIEAVEPLPLPERRPGLLTGSWDDVRHAFRWLRKNPALAGIAIGTLALGIGGNTAIFTLADALVLRGLPYPHAGSLVALETHWSRQSEVEPWTSAPDFFDLRARVQSFSAVAGISPLWNDILTGPSGAERLNTLYVSSNFFPMLGVHAALGRTFSEGEDSGTHPSNVAVVSGGFWRSHFRGGADAIGQDLVLNGQAIRVIGVLPPDFRYVGEPLAGKAAEIDVWMPLSDNNLIARARTVRFLKVIARLKPGVAAERASEEVGALGQALAAEYPASNRGFTLHAVPLADKVTGRLRSMALLLLGAVGFVLLLACANVSNLLLTRVVARQKDFAVRLALGAPMRRLARQIAVEAMLLAVLGGAVGIAMATYGVSVIGNAAPAALTSGYPNGIDWRVLPFTAAAMALSGLISAFPPIWILLRGKLQDALRQGSRTLSGSHHRLRSALVGIEVALALVLLAGAGLLVRSFQRLLDVQPGFDAHNVITVSTQTPPGAQTPAHRTAIYDLIRGRLLDVPGVINVGAVSRLPLMGSNLGSAVTVEGKTRPGEQGPDVEYRVATPSYFETMRIPLKKGRMFTEHDDASAPQVALINEAMARALWPREDPIGKRIKLGPNTESQAWISVVGVIGDVRHFGLDIGARPEVYRPYAASPLYAPILVVRTASDPDGLAGALAARVRSVGAEVPAYDLFSMQALVDRSTAQRRFVMWLLGGFAITALLLAAVGVYGIVSQSVGQRTREIGVRMALGASPSGALALVFGDGMRLVGVGICVGMAAAVGLTRLMRTLLFEVQPFDTVVFLWATALLAGVAAIACFLPALRVTRLDPMTALRQEG